MTLKQLLYLREIARRGLSISAAASALHTSQPGVSRLIQDLEHELGVDLLVRRKNRVLALTPAGRAVLASAERMLDEADNIRALAQEVRDERGGHLALVTSHLHARYTLLGPISTFSARYPEVKLRLLQADPEEVPRLVAAGDADIGVSTDVVSPHPGLALLPARVIKRSLIMPARHALANKKRVTLAQLAKFPLIGYGPRSRGGQVIAQAFEAAGVEARFVVSASDSDVIKAYVAEGLGIAIVPTIALEQADARIAALDVTALFPRSEMIVSLRRGIVLRRYLTDFLQMIVPRLTRHALEEAMALA